MQTRRLLAFCGARLDYWLMFNLDSTEAPGPFLSSYFPDRQPQEVLVRVTVLLQVQDLALPIIKLHEIHAGPFLLLMSL